MYGKHAAECSIATLSLLFLQAVLEQTNYATFQALLQFAATTHQDPNSSNSFAQRRRIIPTALTFAGGVNSADHAQTFPTLVNLLRQQVRSHMTESRLQPCVGVVIEAELCTALLSYSAAIASSLMYTVCMLYGLLNQGETYLLQADARAKAGTGSTQSHVWLNADPV